MKNINKIVVLVLAIIILGAVAWRFSSTKDTAKDPEESEVVVPTSQTVVVSTKISEYKNDELGFSVKYPTVWEKAESANGVLFSAPLDTIKEKNTIGKLSAKVDVVSGKCTFPPVTTVKERDTVKVGDLSFNMISIANTVQSRSYFDRMFSLQKDSVCYFFTFSAITSTPASKGMTVEDAKIASANNTKLVDEADTQFKDMVKSFKLVVGPEGQDETKAPKN